MSNSQRWLAVSVVCTLLTAVSIAPVLLAQTTISTGSIVGTVTDPSGAVVSGAKVTITNKATGQVITTTTTSTGTYASGALNPGDYQLRIEAQGFKTTQFSETVQVNTTASGDAAAMLAACGINTVLLVHELPRLLREKRLEDKARAGITGARHVIFPATFVRDKVIGALDISASEKLVVRPQGSYKRIVTMPDA